MLINAFALLRKSTSARLILIGDGPERDNLKSLIVKHGLETDVSMPGFVSNPYVYFRRSSIFVLSSIWEGLPTVLIEALACGTRIISTDCPSGPKEILDDGRWGILVPVGDIASLAEQMSVLLDQPKPKSIPSSWRKFTVDNSTKAYEDFEEKLTKIKVNIKNFFIILLAYHLHQNLTAFLSTFHILWAEPSMVGIT